MSETTSPPGSLPGSPPAPNARRPSADRLKEIIITLLAPLFLWTCGGDPNFARLAAIEALNEFGITSYRGLITAARIVAFELAALSSLSMSMDDDIPPALALRLRGNANSL